MSAEASRIWMVAGEPSGDMHAGRLLAALAARRPGLRAAGMGGPLMRAAGCEILHPIGGLAVTGLLDVPRILPRLRRLRRELVEGVRREGPQAVVLVDYPGFNLSLAKALRKLPGGPRLIYFIPPQVWAWGAGRARTIARTFDLALTIYPFEPAYFRREGGRAEFVGNPVAYALREAPGRAEARRALGIAPGARVVAFLPGSRPKEVDRHLAPMTGAARLLRERWPDAVFLLSEAEALRPGTVAGRAREEGVTLRVVRGRMAEVARAADAAAVASGTASLEIGLLGTPLVVVYASDPFTHLVAKYFFIRVDYLSLVNLLAGREAAPELHQGRVRPAPIAEALARLVEEPGARERQRGALEAIRRSLEGPHPYGRAAERIIELLESGR